MKKIDRLFDMICHLSDNKKSEYTIKDGVSLKPSKLQAFIQKQMHESIIASSTQVPNTNKAIQAFTGSTDLTEMTKNVWNAFQETPNFDTLWQAAFRTVPLRKGQLSWEIGNVVSGVAFKLLEEGGKVEYAGITGSKITGNVELYGSGLSLSWTTIEGRDLAGFYNAMTDFRAKRMTEYADIFYGLLATAAATNAVAYQSGTTTLDKDINTLNKGYDTIGTACKDKGFGDTANARMICYAAPSLRGRLNQALKATNSDLVRGKDGINVYGNIEILYTYNSNIPANKVVMVLPGNKIQNAIYMQEKSFERTDPDNLNMLKSSFTAIGGIVGEADQTVELSFV